MPQLLLHLSDKYLVTDGTEWRRPSELYIRANDIRTGYPLVKGILKIPYLSSSYDDGVASLKLDDSFFRKIGCNYGIRARSISSDEYLSAVRKYCGSQACLDLRNRIFSKTNISRKFDWSFDYEGFPAVLSDITKEKSLAIARFLNTNAESFTVRGDLVGADDQHFSGKNIDSMVAYSMLGLHLSFTKWIFVSGNPYPQSVI